MITVAIFNIFVVLFAFLDRYKGMKFGLKGSFFLIFIFLALRYGFGNDYHEYLSSFIDINNYYAINYFAKDLFNEAGWLLLCRLFSPFGFFVMVAFLAIFNCLVFYHFIKKYVPPAYHWFAVFLYVFNPYFMLVHSSAMRQSIAINIFIYSIDFIYMKDAIRYYLCIGLAILFHASAVVLLPVYFFGLFNWKIGKFSAFIIFSAFLSLFGVSKFLLPYLEQIVSTYFVKYELYLGPEKIGTGLGIIFNIGVFLLLLFYLQNQKKDTTLVFKIAIISYFCLPIGLIMMMIGRIDMYFAPATLAALPIILMSIQNRLLKLTFGVLLIFMTVFSFYIFFKSEIYGEAFSTYRTIFTAPEIY